MMHYMKQLLGLALVVLVTLGPVAALAHEWHAASPSSRCPQKPGCRQGAAEGLDGLLQEPALVGRSVTQSLMQESFRLHRTSGYSKDASPLPPAQPSQWPQQPAAVAAAPSGPAVLQRAPEELQQRRQPRGKGSAEASLEAAFNASAAESRPPAFPAEDATRQQEAAAAAAAPAPPAAANPSAAGPLPAALPGKAGRQELHLAPPEPLPLPPRVGRSSKHMMLQASEVDTSPGLPGVDLAAAAIAAAATGPGTDAAAVPAVKNSEDGRSGLSVLFGVLGRVLLLLLCVALILRFLVFKAASSHCRRASSRQTSGSGAPAPAAASRWLSWPSQWWGRAQEAGRTAAAVDASQPAAGISAGPFLCPELVVPEGKECKLVVPRLPLSSLGSGGKVSICDQHGVPVLRACFSFLACPGGARGPRLRDMKRLVLTSATGETAFAFCREAEAVSAGSGRPSRLALYHRSEEPFGVLSADGFEAGSGYSVVTQKGCTIYFRAGMKAGVMNATDDSGRLLAVVEPSGQTQTLLRVGQLVDAGLITLTIMGIDVLENGGPGSRSDAELNAL